MGVTEIAYNIDNVFGSTVHKRSLYAIVGLCPVCRSTFPMLFRKCNAKVRGKVLLLGSVNRTAGRTIMAYWSVISCDGSHGLVIRSKEAAEPDRYLKRGGIGGGQGPGADTGRSSARY